MICVCAERMQRRGIIVPFGQAFAAVKAGQFRQDSSGSRIFIYSAARFSSLSSIYIFLFCHPSHFSLSLPNSIHSSLSAHLLMWPSCKGN